MGPLPGERLPLRLSVRVLSRRFRRRFLAGLVKLHREGRRAFFGDHAGRADGSAFDAVLEPLRRIDWVVYAKEPPDQVRGRLFAGPKAVLAHLSRHTHRVAISNSRLIRADAHSVTFRVKDYRSDGSGRGTTMTLATREFIRRVLLHLLPRGFHRIRHATCPGPDPGASRATAIAPPTSPASARCWRRALPRPTPRVPAPRTGRASSPSGVPAAADA